MGSKRKAPTPQNPPAVFHIRCAHRDCGSRVTAAWSLHIAVVRHLVLSLGWSTSDDVADGSATWCPEHLAYAAAQRSQVP